MSKKILGINPLADFLKQKLKEQGLSATKLAKRVDYNGGSIRSIVNGTRVPKFKSPIIEKIANALSIPLKEIETYHLQSIEIKNSVGVKQRGRPSLQLQQLAEPLTGIVETRDFELLGDYRPNKEERCGAVGNEYELIQTRIRMLQELLVQEVPEQNYIYVSFFGKKSVFAAQKELALIYQKTLSELIDKGWHVFHIMRLDASVRDRTYELVSNTFRFFSGKGSYHPCYLDTRTALKVPYGVFLISNREAILSFSTDREEAVGAGIFIRDAESIKVIKSHCETLRNAAKPIFKTFTCYEQKEFVEKLRAADAEPGERIILTQRLSEITRPLNWYQSEHDWAKALVKYLQETTQQPWPNMSAHIDNRKRRASQLVDNIERGRYTRRYIYPRFIVEKFIENGKPKPYYFKANKNQRIEQLKVMLSLLEKDTYQMALVSNEQEDIFRRIRPSFCEVQGSHFVFMEFSRTTTHGKKISTWYTSDDPIVVHAFRERLSSLWNKLSTEYTDKFLISTWLRRQIEKLEEAES